MRLFCLFRITLIIPAILTFYIVKAQDNKRIIEGNLHQLIAIRNEVLAAENDSTRFRENEDFIILLENTLQLNGAFKANLDSIPNMVSFLPDNKKFKLINWNVPYDNGEQKYFGFIQVWNKKKKRYYLYKLNDKSDEYEEPDYKRLNTSNWYGALYYDVIPVKDRRKKYYVLLGWDGFSNIMSQKIIDVLYFSSSGTPIFGKDVFKMGRRTKRRVIFKFAGDAIMSLKFNKKENRIVFDHLSPRTESLKGSYQFYGPDFTYDALELKKRKWYLIENINAQGQRKNDRPYTAPK